MLISEQTGRFLWRAGKRASGAMAAAGVALCLVATSAIADGPAIDAGFQLEYVYYREPSTMHEAGFLGGVFARVKTTGPWGGDCHAFVSYVGGELTYESHPSTGLDLEGDTPNTILDLRGGYAPDLDIQNGACRPYIGLGYRQLVDDLPDIGGYRGYKREQLYYYIPVGADLSLAERDAWTYSARLEYDIFVAGLNKSLGEELEQDSGLGLRGSLTMMSQSLKIADRAGLGFELFFQYWRVGASSTEGFGIYEPKNSSTMVGVRAIAHF